VPLINLGSKVNQGDLGVSIWEWAQIYYAQLYSNDWLS